MTPDAASLSLKDKKCADCDSLNISGFWGRDWLCLTCVWKRLVRCA